MSARTDDDAGSVERMVCIDVVRWNWCQGTANAAIVTHVFQRRQNLTIFQAFPKSAPVRITVGSVISEIFDGEAVIMQMRTGHYFSRRGTPVAIDVFVADATRHQLGASVPGDPAEAFPFCTDAFRLAEEQYVPSRHTEEVCLFVRRHDSNMTSGKSTEEQTRYASSSWPWTGPERRRVRPVRTARAAARCAS